MTSIINEGAYAVQVDGDFDDCQQIVKDLFEDMSFKERVNLSAVNSINWVRVVPQIVYYFYSAFKLDHHKDQFLFLFRLEILEIFTQDGVR